MNPNQHLTQEDTSRDGSGMLHTPCKCDCSNRRNCAYPNRGGAMKKIINLVVILSLASILGVVAFGGQMDLTGAGLILLFAAVLVVIGRVTR
jgi:hypothetical protein